MEEDWDPLARRVPSFGRGLRILLVDHDTTSLLYISSILESHSFKVTTMELASLAMSIFEQRKDEFDLVMADVNMQDMTNLGFIQQVLRMKNHMPIVLMSSRYAGKVVAEQALRDGACFFLQKPVSNNDLRDLWQHVYRKRKSSEEESDEGSVDSESESQSVRMKEESGDAVRNDQFREVGIVSRANSWTSNENGEPWMADLKGKNELMKQENDLVEGDAQTAEDEPLRNGRKRSNEDNIEQRKCKRKINSEQIPSQGKSPIEEEGDEKKEKGSTLEKRLYMKWTPDLHFKFTEAIRKLGDKKASPKAILELMNVPDLKQGHISSHLQKYKAQLRSMFEVSGNTSLPLPSSVNISTSGGVRQTGVPQFQEQQGSVGVNDNSSLQLHPQLSLKASPVPGYAWHSNSIENKLHPNPTKNNNGVQIAGYGKHQWPSQTREWRGPFLSDVNMNENGKGKQILGFQGKSYPNVALDQTNHKSAAQHCWQSLTEFPTPLKRLNQRQNMVAGLTSSASRPNSDIPAGIFSTGDTIPQLAHLGSSGNQSIAYCPSTGQDGLDESSVDLLTEWLCRSLDEA